MERQVQIQNVLLGFLVCLWQLLDVVRAEICDAGHSCRGVERCCGDTCCIPQDYHDTYRTMRWSIWNMWYFWFVVIFVLMSCFGGCGYWRRRRLLLSEQGHDFTTVHLGGPPTSFGHYSNGRSATATATAAAASHYPSSITIPIFVSRGRGGGFAFGGPASASPLHHDTPQGEFPNPPAYSEVISKPEDFPLRDKDDLPPYPGYDLAMGSNANGGVTLDDATTTQSTDQHPQPALPPYTPTESGTAQPGVMTSGARSSPPPSYQL